MTNQITIYDKTPVMLHTVDRTGRLLSVSDFWLQVMGDYSRDEVIGRNIGEFMTEKSRRYAHEVSLPHFFGPSGGLVRDVEYEFVRKDGQVIDVLLSAVAEHDAEGRVLRALAVSIDVTERKRAEEALRLREEHFRTLFESAPIGMAINDDDGRFVQCNRAWQRLFGYSAAEFETFTFTDITHPDDQEASWRIHHEVRHSQQRLFNIEKRYIRKDGEIIWCRTTVFDMRDAMGQHLYSMVVAEDITERKRIEIERALTLQLLEQRVETRTREIARRQRVAESLRGILRVLNSDRSLDEMLDYIVAEATVLLDSDASAIYELQIENGEMKIQTAQGVADVSRLAFPAVLEQSLQGAKPIAVCNVQPRPSINRSGLAQVVRGSALLGVPLVVDSELYGCLVLYYTQSRLFSDEEIDLAGSFGDQVALAIENARLRQRVEQAAIVAERHRLARELHDSVTQSLYSLTLLAEGWRRMAQSGELESMEDALVELGDIGRQALKEMRLMVHELRPPVLENEGLLGALHSRLNSVEKRAGIQMRLVADELPELPLHVEETLYRIAQEALNNALKHAAARSVKVHIAIEDERLIMSVEDDGCGFDQDQVQHSGGVGLHSMRERAARLGAVYELVSVPGHGTSICVQLALGDVSR